jgi:hypothetical protein
MPDEHRHDRASRGDVMTTGPSLADAAFWRRPLEQRMADFA